jgi:hypothetical protein
MHAIFSRQKSAALSAFQLLLDLKASSNVLSFNIEELQSGGTNATISYSSGPANASSDNALSRCPGIGDKSP